MLLILLEVLLHTYKGLSSAVFRHGSRETTTLREYRLQGDYRGHGHKPCPFPFGGDGCGFRQRL
jgi:hypothetical protein